MMELRHWRCLLVILAFSAFAECHLTTTSSTSATVSEGQAVSFNCQTEPGKKIRWEHYPDHHIADSDSDPARTVYNGYETHPLYESRVTVYYDNNTGICVLHVLSVQVTDAGSFECSESSSADTKLVFKLEIGNTERRANEEIKASNEYVIIGTIATVCVVGVVVAITLAAVCVRQRNFRAEEQSDQSKVTYSTAAGARPSISIPDALNTINISDGYSLATASHRPSRTGSGVNIYSQIADGEEQIVVVSQPVAGEINITGSDANSGNAYDGLDQEDVAATRATQLPSTYITLAAVHVNSAVDA